MNQSCYALIGQDELGQFMTYHLNLYGYDSFDQLVSATQEDCTLEMSYNAEGLRISKEVTIDGQRAEVLYLYENDNVVLELDGSGVHTAYSVYGGETLLSKASGGETLYYLYNGHGDVTALTDGEGDIVASRYYNPETARFMSEDTHYGNTADPLSLNLYTYCANNPIIYIDPTGHALTQWDTEHCTAGQIAKILLYA